MLKVFDYKKEFKNLYLPKCEPTLVEVPSMIFLMVDGEKDPNDNPSYQEAVSLLYTVAYTIKMSKMQGNQPKGYFDFVVPPLEGLWSISNGVFDFSMRDNWIWTSMLRVPDFVTKDVFEEVIEKAKRKNPELDFSRVRLGCLEEGLCVQMLHIGPYVTESETLSKMQEFMADNNLIDDIYGDVRKHHEIYLSDPRKTESVKLKTVLRHPVKRK